MKLLTFRLILLMFLLPCLCFGQKFIFKDSIMNKEKKEFKKILMVGFGSVETRQFLESLSSKLTSEFKSFKIESEFDYLGKDPKGDTEEIKNLLSKGFNAIIIFSPEDSANLFLYYFNKPTSEDFNINPKARYITIHKNYI